MVVRIGKERSLELKISKSSTDMLEVEVSYHSHFLLFRPTRFALYILHPILSRKPHNLCMFNYLRVVLIRIVGGGELESVLDESKSHDKSGNFPQEIVTYLKGIIEMIEGGEERSESSIVSTIINCIFIR